MKQIHTLILACAVVGLAACSEDAPAGPAFVPVAGITLDQPSLALKPGRSKPLAATVNPEDATDKAVVWSSDDPNVATVDKEGVVTGINIGKTTVRVTSVADKLIKERCIVTVMASDPYVVGDLYPNATNPLGMVFWIDPADVAKGKIISLDEVLKKWGASGVITDAQDLSDGMANLETIRAIEGWQADYPAFDWCANKGAGWYLPALNEMLDLYEVKDTLNEIILENGDVPFAENDYWTSTEQPENPRNIAITVRLLQQNDNEGWLSKDATCRTRAIMEF